MIKAAIALVCCGLFLASCAARENEDGMPRPAPAPAGQQTYLELRQALEAGGDRIDYDTLVHVYRTMTRNPYEIRHTDRLLASLIHKRNDNPRVDQMILIFAAKILGGSRHPVNGAAGLFESILSQDERLNAWVIAFVAEAIGDYPVEMPQGRRLVDLLEKKLAAISSDPGPPKEYFGSHFLPPPKGEVVRSYIAGIQDRALRVSERNHYYLLIVKGYTEGQIEKALKRLQTEGRQARGAPPAACLKYLFLNQKRID